MKKLSAKQLAMSYTGVFLGAGFVYGQELWQFFACFGPVGLLGFLGTAALFFYVNYANLRMIQITGVEDMGRLMTRGNGTLLRSVVTFMQCLLLFGVAIIMIAGAASLLNQLLGMPAWIAGLCFTVLVSLIALMGLQGLVAVFSMLVPATTVVAVILAAAALVRGDFQFAPANGSVSPLMPNWIIGFITYAAYNLFGTISVLVPTAKLLDGEKPVRKGLGRVQQAVYLHQHCCSSRLFRRYSSSNNERGSNLFRFPAVNRKCIWRIFYSMRQSPGALWTAEAGYHVRPISAHSCTG